MFAAIPLITARLADALPSGWVVSDGTQHVDRSALPRAEVRLSGAGLDKSSGPTVVLRARCLVQLCVSTQDTAFAVLDAAVDAVIASMHHWSPGAGYDRLQLESFAELEVMDQSLFGYQFAFTFPVVRAGFNG
jgi:hypothetical protein